MGKRSAAGGSGKGAKKHKAYSVLEPGWQGVFVTCPRGRETACRAEIIALAEEHAQKLWPELNDDNDEDNDDNEQDIEALIKQEIAAIKDRKTKTLIQGHMIGIECVVFIRTKAPIDPVKLVISICEEALETKEKKTRYVQRLSPTCGLVHATLENIEKLKPVVESEFKDGGFKFAIRPTIRNNTQIPRDELITAVARLVGPGNSVNLKDYDKLILVDCFKSVLGLSIVDQRFETLSRFNLTHIHERLIAAEAAEAEAAEAQEKEETE